MADNENADLVARLRRLADAAGEECRVASNPDEAGKWAVRAYILDTTADAIERGQRHGLLTPELSEAMGAASIVAPE